MVTYVVDYVIVMKIRLKYSSFYDAPKCKQWLAHDATMNIYNKQMNTHT